VREELSGGQRQRIAIARALLKKSKYFDSGWSHIILDSESEKLVQEALEILIEGEQVLLLHTVYQPFVVPIKY
jgi:ABC-type multidrug transport system fused ATPase/permease subunit